MKKIQILLVLCVISATYACNNGDTKFAKNASFKVWGNCEMCAKTIEGGLDTKGILLVNWNKDTKILDVNYDSTLIILPQIHQKVAATGYDTELLGGNDVAYANLNECCQYERKP